MFIIRVPEAFQTAVCLVLDLSPNQALPTAAGRARPYRSGAAPMWAFSLRIW